MTYPGPRGRETVRPMIPEIGWLRASAERARAWADADGDRLLVPLEDATRAVRDARAAARQRTVAEIVAELREHAAHLGNVEGRYYASAANYVEQRFGAKKEDS